MMGEKYIDERKNSILFSSFSVYGTEKSRKRNILHWSLEKE
jgi:hypothetical protein